MSHGGLMRHLTILSILSIIFAFSAAQAETKISGEFWADFDYVLSNGETTATDDTISPMGFVANRARLGVEHSLNDNWSLTFKYDLASSAIARAYLTGKDWIVDGSTMTLGLQSNAYRAAYDKHHHAWIHRDLTTTFASALKTGYGLVGVANLDNFTGLNVNFMLNDMWNASVTINNGPNTNISNNGNAGTNSDAVGYALTVEGKINDNFGLLLGYDTSDVAFTGTSEAAANETVDGFTATRAAVLYTNDMIDASFEYAMWDHAEAVSGGTDLESTSAMALSLDYKMDQNFVHLYYAMTTDFDNGTATDDVVVDAGVDTVMTIGHVWGLDKNINTGLFYTATTRENAAGNNLDTDESMIEWKWAANF